MGLKMHTAQSFHDVGSDCGTHMPWLYWKTISSKAMHTASKRKGLAHNAIHTRAILYSLERSDRAVPYATLRVS